MGSELKCLGFNSQGLALRFRIGLPAQGLGFGLNESSGRGSR